MAIVGFPFLPTGVNVPVPNNNTLLYMLSTLGAHQNMSIAQAKSLFSSGGGGQVTEIIADIGGTTSGNSYTTLAAAIDAARLILDNWTNGVGWVRIIIRTENHTSTILAEDIGSRRSSGITLVGTFDTVRFAFTQLALTGASHFEGDNVGAPNALLAMGFEDIAVSPNASGALIDAISASVISVVTNISEVAFGLGSSKVISTPVGASCELSASGEKTFSIFGNSLDANTGQISVAFNSPLLVSGTAALSGSGNISFFGNLEFGSISDQPSHTGSLSVRKSSTAALALASATIKAQDAVGPGIVASSNITIDHTAVDNMSDQATVKIFNGTNNYIEVLAINGATLKGGRFIKGNGTAEIIRDGSVYLISIDVLEEIEFKTEASSSLTPDKTYFGEKITECTNSGAITITLDEDSEIPTTTATFRVTHATGVVTFAAGVGVTIESKGGLLSSDGEHSLITVIKKTNTLYILSGDLA